MHRKFCLLDPWHHLYVYQVQVNKFGDPTSDDANKGSIDFMIKFAQMYASNKITQPDLYVTRNNELSSLGFAGGRKPKSKAEVKPEVDGSAVPKAKVCPQTDRITQSSLDRFCVARYARTVMF